MIVQKPCRMKSFAGLFCKERSIIWKQVPCSNQVDCDGRSNRISYFPYLSLNQCSMRRKEPSVTHVYPRIHAQCGYHLGLTFVLFQQIRIRWHYNRHSHI
eukprot:Lithocolla_globosa_v1_NODE_2197_length_2114_cov_4.329772.p2 type:complete len:100 gc:universal NODE_2197_length_2114_cov_4.329772:821-522(-)